ncbi:hypothetical protein HDR58_02215 [bacterium]|nr:hypothetical protein [bacterium]
MKISQLSKNSYNYSNNNNINFKQKHKNNKIPQNDRLTPERIMKLYAAGALTSVVMAYGGSQVILNNYKNNVNRILDKYEQEIQNQKQELDSIFKNIDNIDFDESTLEYKE